MTKTPIADGLAVLHETLGDSMDGFDPQAHMREMRGTEIDPAVLGALRAVMPFVVHGRLDNGGISDVALILNRDSNIPGQSSRVSLGQMRALVAAVDALPDHIKAQIGEVK